MENLLPLFKELLDLTNKGEKPMKEYCERSLQPKEIVTQWYQLGGAALAGVDLTPAEQAQIMLTYVNPFYSLSEPDISRIEMTDILVKTYKENDKTKGPKESQEASRDRFHKELQNIIGEYIAEHGGSRSCEAGQRLIRNKLTQLLVQQVDRMVLDALPANSAIGRDPGRPAEGTVFTRLYEELQEAAGDSGPLAKISSLVGEVAKNLAKEYSETKQGGVNSINALQKGKKRRMVGWHLGGRAATHRPQGLPDVYRAFPKASPFARHGFPDRDRAGTLFGMVESHGPTARALGHGRTRQPDLPRCSTS